MNNPLGRALNTVTMHRLVRTILLGQVLIACVLGAFGFIAYSPLHIIVGASLVVLISIGANALFAKVYGVRSDSQSAIVTGLILALVMMPTLDLNRLLVYALIAVIAQASKYVVTIRDRHIFNPAAIAIVIASVASLGYASWWIASPPQALFLLSGAFVMLYKVRLLQMGAIFVAFSTAIVTVQNLLVGDGFGNAFLTAFTSWPILFFAGFMLSEPTTLPPRKWQKFLVASIVGILFALPVHVGSFSSSPAVALIIGNIIAFGFGQRRAIVLRLKEIRQLTPTSKEIVFQSDSPAKFIPGQYLELNLPHKKADDRGSRRSFSLTSVPESREVSIGIRTSEPSSSFKTKLLALKPGEKVIASNISGDFVLPNDPKQKLVFIAGGIGITPFISQIKSLQATKETRHITLLYFVRDEQEIAYRDIVQSVATTIIYGRDLFDMEQLIRLVPNIKHSQIFISGPPQMVDGMISLTHKAGARHIKTDYFSGY